VRLWYLSAAHRDTTWELEVQLEWQKPAWHFLPMKQQATLGQQKSKL